MNTIKNTEKNKTTKFLLGLLIFAFILSSISGIMFMTNKYNVIITNDKNININEFVKILNNEKQRIYASQQDDNNIDFLNSREFMTITLNNLLYNTLIDQEINKYNLKEPDEIILSKISKEQYFYTNNKFDINKFKQMLTSYNITEYDYIEIIKDADSVDFLMSLINNNFKNDFIVDSIFKKENKNKITSIFAINKKLIKTKNINISSEDIKNYYDENINNFEIPENRKIDYIEVENFKNEDINKIEELLLTSNTLEEIAKNINLKTKTFGYINNKDINEISEKYTDKKNSLLSYKINDFSNIKKIDNNLYILSVVDIKSKRLKTLEESQDEIKNIIIENNKNKEYKDIVANYIENYKKNKNNNTLIKIGFSITNAEISKNGNNDKYDINFVNSILNTEKNNATEIFIDDTNIYFAYIKDDKLIKEDSEFFVSKYSIEDNLKSLINNNIQKEYIEYLKNTKYKVKINYKLLNLIK